ncbi:MAG: universal stress protein [Coriobacteriia bacterium]
MFSRAIICTDLSPSSGSIVACAGALGVLGVREAVLTHVIDIGEPAPSSATRSVDAMFGRQAADLEGAGIRVRVDTSVGYPSYAIEEVAARHNADLIVIGSHRKGLFATTFSGSVSSDVVRISTRPVLLAVLVALGSEEQSQAVCGRLLHHVLFPVDLEPGSATASQYVLGLADRAMGAIDLLHVVDNSSANGVENRRRDATTELSRLADALRDAGVEVTTEIVVGSPDREAAARAGSGKHTMVVMAPHCDDGNEYPLGSVTHAVVQSTMAPLLLIPPNCRRDEL